MYRTYSVDLYNPDMQNLIKGYEKEYNGQNLGLTNFRKLISHVNSNGLLNMNDIQDEWFPNTQDYHVFLSHSHADKKQVYQFANFLEKRFKIKCFIDSQLWGYSLNLLREIDDKYCFSPDSDTYSYELRNQSTAHIHMMLATSLIKMMNNCQCFIFLNSDNSAYKNNNNELCTHSTWVNLELYMTQVIKINPPPIPIFESAVSIEDSKKYIPTEYKIDLNNLPIIHPKTFNNCAKNNLEGQSFLNYLYENIKCDKDK